MRSNYGYIVLCILLFCGSCTKESDCVNSPRELGLNEIPAHFPSIEFPEDNGFTPARWELGKRLFYDAILSRDLSLSCASCHQADKAFSDGEIKSIGIEQRLGDRNAPSLANVAYHPYLLREGGVPSLEMQVFVPIQEHSEFDFNMVEAVERLLNDETYVQQSLDAYDRNPDAFVLTRALANFQRTLISGSSKYDLYLSEENCLTEEEALGLDLFFSERLQCSTCHSGHNFTNYEITNNGLYEEYVDEGKFRLTQDSADLATFKIASLRNVALTAPYMHDGSMHTLEEVIDHYSSGGKDHINRDLRMKSFSLTMTEKSSLIAFLNTLTDRGFTSNKLFQK